MTCIGFEVYATILDHTVVLETLILLVNWQFGLRSHDLSHVQVEIHLRQNVLLSTLVPYINNVIERQHFA